jgi:type IV pilus assembly protein PilM
LPALAQWYPLCAEGRAVFGLTKKSKPVVGLDIGSSAVKAVELRPAGKSYKVMAVGVEPVPPDSIVDGAIIDGAAVADAIKRLFENKAFKSKDVAASLSGNAVIVKKISLPVMTEAELSESIYWEAEQYIPFDIQDVNLDYQILDAGTGADSKGTMDVLLVAAKKEKIADYTGVIAQAGKVPVVVDVDAFALQNAYEMNYGNDPQQVVVLLNAGASAININIISGDQSVFTRDISMGGNAYTEAVQKELNLPFDSAEALKKGEPVDGLTFEAVQPVLHAMTENVLLEIQKTFDFFKASATSDRIDRVLLSGGASRVDGFQKALEDRFATVIEPFNPFQKISFDAAKLGVTDPERMTTATAVAVGLALRTAGDR